MTSTPSSNPRVWAVVLGYNHPELTVDCLQSLAKATYQPLTVLYVDNGSESANCQKVMDTVSDCSVLRLDPNAGAAGGLNAGIRYAFEQGADHVVILNNDTTVHPTFIDHLVQAAIEHPKAGMFVPKIYYYDHPDTIWSAGSVFRRFPPVVYMRKTRRPDDGRFDEPQDLNYATFCIIMFSRAMIEQVGLLDTDYHFLYEDYDLCIRSREAGFGIRYVPAARVWHKVSMTTGAGTPNPKFWRTYGRSESIFRRKFRRYRWLTGWTHAIYIVARFVAEGNWYGFKPYIQGWRQGARDPLHPPPRVQDPPPAPRQILRNP
ncbi:MAG: glycosyltransferase family 2 protein [Lentisphaerae bacterium]|jgi:GT2 family glycosyltransferase|nr:glycosyltransferase family 2 protein [Lentisphaerota bacterium]